MKINILFLAIIKALAGFPDRSTDFVDVNRIPILYDSLSDALQEFDYEDPDLIRNVRDVIFTAL